MTHEEFLKALPDLVKNYEPSAQILARISDVDLLMIVGPTGVGKTTIIKHLGIPFVPIDTTRPRRADEVEGMDYFFRTDYDQLLEDIKNHLFVQFVVGLQGEFYGTRASLYPEVGMAAFAVLAEVVPQFRKMGFKETYTFFITPPSFLEWMDRMGQTGADRDQLVPRLKEARRSFEFALSDDNTHFILNDAVDKAVQQINNALVGRVDIDRETQAREAAQRLSKEMAFA